MGSLKFLKLIEEAAGKRVTELHLAGQRLTELPPEIGQLTDLETLEISWNMLITLPSEIGQLTSLKELGLWHNRLTVLPPEIGQLINLERLYLGSNQLAELPLEIGQLTSLKVLSLFFNGLTALPPEIGQLINLKELELNENQLSALPPEIGQPINLKVLNLSGNQLTELPPEIGQLINLKELELSENQLTELPPEIGQLTGLEVLNLRRNQLTELPPEIGQLINLKVLNLSGNQLSALPPEIGQLINLKELELNENQLSALPPEIGQLTGLRELELRGNNLPIPPEILAKAEETDAIISFFLAPQVAAKRKPLNEAKVLLVGQQGVGKTSLVRRLTDDKFDPDETKTEGIDIRRWGVSIDGREVHLSMWDFGGQEIMHATHQFFLTERSLYMLVLDARQDEYDNRIEYWLKLIQSFGGDSPIIVVVNKCDLEPNPDIDRPGLQAKYPSIKGFANTSCKTKQGVQELEELISRAVGQLDHIHDELPASWFAVKTELEQMEEDYIPYARYEEMCQAKDITDERSQSTLIRFLHDLGVVLSFREDPRLQETNILNPEWVTTGVYRILNSNLLFQQKGVLDRQLLTAILDSPTHPRDKHLFIMDIMRKFELCFLFEDSANWRFLIPDLLPKEEPYTGEWHDIECLGFQWHYNVLPGTIISRFIVRSHQLIYKNIRWRNGVVLARGKNRALVKADPEERKIYIRIAGPVQTRREFLAVIRAEFDHIHRTISKLEVRENIPLPHHPGVTVDYHHLRTLEDLEKATFVPEGLREEINVKQLLDGIETEEQRQEPYQREHREEMSEPHPTSSAEPEGALEDGVLAELTKIKTNLDRNAERRVKRWLVFYISVSLSMWVGLGYATIRFNWWGKYEPLSFFIPIVLTLGNYLYWAITQRELGLKALYAGLVEKRKAKNYREFGFDHEKYERLQG